MLWNTNRSKHLLTENNRITIYVLAEIPTIIQMRIKTEPKRIGPHPRSRTVEDGEKPDVEEGKTAFVDAQTESFVTLMTGA